MDVSVHDPSAFQTSGCGASAFDPPGTAPSVGAAETRLLLRWQRQAGFPTPTVGVIPFWDRPYRTVDPAVPQALLDQITDLEVARLPAGVGSIEQWVDSTDVLTHPGRRAAVRSTYLSSLAT